MRTNIDIDDKLMKQAMKATGATTKKAAVEACMRQMVRLTAQEGILKWFGKIKWEGNLDAMREGRFWDVNDDASLSKLVPSTAKAGKKKPTAQKTRHNQRLGVAAMSAD